MVIVTISSCKAKKEIIDNKESDSQIEKKVDPYKYNKELSKDSIFFSMERTACYGKCPTYKLIVYASGELQYHGKQNVKNIGAFEGTVSEDIRMFIIDEAKKAGYFDLEDTYDSRVSDLPACITYLNTGIQSKKIYDRHGGPEAIKQFQKAVEAKLNAIQLKSAGGR
jgi:hypothetical protein